MADTIVNTPAQESGSAGWAVALILVLAVVVGGFVWFYYYGPSMAPTQAGDTNINVTIPTPVKGTGGTATP